MGLRKLERSCRIPSGWRLASVEEAKENLEMIKKSNLLGEWDRARLLDGWIGGSAYDFTVEQSFKSCLGYMLLIYSPTPEISNTDDRNAAIYSKLPELSKGGRSVALLLCCEDWNEDVLCWLMMAGEREEKGKSMCLWERDRADVASRVLSAVARGFQSVRGKPSIFPATMEEELTESLMPQCKVLLKALAVESKEYVKSLQMFHNQNSELGNVINEYLDELLDDLSGYDLFAEMKLSEDWVTFKNLGFDTSMLWTRKAVVQTFSYFLVESFSSVLLLDLCLFLYERVVNPIRDNCLASLIDYSYNFLSKPLRPIISNVEVVSGAAKEANGDCKRFDEIVRGKGFLTFICKDNDDVLSAILLTAAKKGDVGVVRMLVKHNVEVSARKTTSRKTALHYAALQYVEDGGLEIAKMVLEKEGSLANEVDSANRRPLHSAAAGGHLRICKLLLENNASLTSKDWEGLTALHCACTTVRLYDDVVRYLYDDVVRYLISADEKKNVNVNVEGSGDRLVDVKDNRGKTALDYAFRGKKSHANTVAWMLSRCSVPEMYFKEVAEELSMYLRECLRGGCKLDLVVKLLKEGADPFDGDDDGKTALHYAAEGEDEEVAVDIVMQFMRYGKEAGSTNIDKALVGDKYGRNVLHFASFLGREGLCLNVIEMVDARDRDGQSAIHYAVAGGHDNPRVLKQILGKQRKKLVFARDFSQTTPLHVAAGRGNLKMVKALISEVSEEEERKNYVDAADVLGQTALHKAASGGHVEIVKILLANGGHPLKERDCDGKTALHFAGEATGENAVKIARLLLESCESDSQKSLLLFASPVGIGKPDPPLIGIGKPDPSLEKYLRGEKEKIKKGLCHDQTLLQVAARVGDVDMTREFITKGADIARIQDKNWIKILPTDEKNNVQDVLDQIETIVEQVADKPALQDNLGRNPLAIGLAALFINPFVKSPITVGISGEWGMGKSSVMVQTESILLKTAAQLAFPNQVKKNDIVEAGESKLSVTWKARRRKIANGIENSEANRWIGVCIMVNILYFIKRATNFTIEILEAILSKRKKQATQGDLQNYKMSFWSALKDLWEKSAPFDLPKFNKFLRKKYEFKNHQILKSLAVMDKHDMLEGDLVNQMEEYSLQGTTPSILTVQYNAWHYRNETEAWAGLALKITEEFEATMTAAHRLRTSWIYNWKTRRNSICLNVIFPFFISLLVAIFFSIIVWLVLGTTHSNDIKKLRYGGLPVSIIIAVWGLAKSIMSFVKPISSQVVDYICLPDHSQKLGYHQNVINDINFLKEQLYYRQSWKWEMFAFVWCWATWNWSENYIPGTRIPKMPPAFSDNLRIIVFVDDLDRCEETVILQVLSAVNLVLATCQINVILSMESSMIQRAIISKYGNNEVGANSKFNEHLADKYLRKIIQLPLQLPDPSEKECREFLETQLGKLDSIKGSTGQNKKTYGRKKGNPKFQIGNSSAEKSKIGRGETKKYLRDKQGAPSFSDTTQKGLVRLEEDNKVGKPEISEAEDAKIEIPETTIEKPGERASPFAQIFRYVCEPICLFNVRSKTTKRDEQGDQEQQEGRKDDLSLIICEMLMPKYSTGERKAFHFLQDRCTDNRKLPRDWKCFLAYHRLAWNILYLSPEVIDAVEGWQVQLIAWIFVCWEWRDLITTLIQNWNNLGVLRKGKVVEENTISGPSLREIVEHYIDERWPAEKRRATKEKDTPAIASLSNTKEVDKNILPEENEATEGDDHPWEIIKEMREILRKSLKEQEELREALKKNSKEHEEMREMLEMIKKKVFEEEEEKKREEREQSTTAGDREEWNRLKETLRHYNVSMDGIQAFQKFRFYCQPGYLPWPLPEQA